MLKTALSHEIKGKRRRSNCLDKTKVPPLIGINAIDAYPLLTRGLAYPAY